MRIILLLLVVTLALACSESRGVKLEDNMRATVQTQKLGSQTWTTQGVVYRSGNIILISTGDVLSSQSEVYTDGGTYARGWWSGEHYIEYSNKEKE